ncbi:aspartyl-phosphate phosphatase Spo0E family protein [Clostridium beijerinckii]|uniref:aspartyl-phosphate phosphatase Spo0E family protein n=1 Tax=Clostridium beijerinckii TaxID=1520 RepID=UPI00098CC378|nr:aspartyl-phosphate phosphatase Spo0E family protein [Clostridium beijerinckii]NRT76348.1 ApbE superfamily uncharacterized protein (UPF0280 family) [Clostridium beijerinckii]OOM48615.1 Spo0E like sporulation regulatory protein [Clostridium beijerinckii]
MQGFMIYCNGTKEETMEELDRAIEKAKAEMETSIDNNPNLTADETVKLSQKLDPLIAHKQRMMIYGC